VRISIQRNHLNIGKGIINPYDKYELSKNPDQSNQESEAVESQKELAPDEASTAQNSSKTKMAPSKREIMEQLSRERFPWDD